jgi:hypothetical protein
MCDCDIDLAPIVNELMRQRPIIPAPGWRAFYVSLSEDEQDYLHVSEITPIFGWQSGDGTSYELVGRHGRCSEDHHIVLAPGEELDREAALRKARMVVILLVEKKFEYWHPKKKEAWRKLFPGVTGRSSLEKQSNATLYEVWYFVDLETDEVDEYVKVRTEKQE